MKIKELWSHLRPLFCHAVLVDLSCKTLENQDLRKTKGTEDASKPKNQPSFSLHQTEHRHGKELEEISRILDENPTLGKVVLQESKTDPGRGAPGMSGEQILRCAIVKQMERLSYDRLSFALEDSLMLRDFCPISFCRAPKRSTLAENISRIGWQSWKKITDILTR